MRWIRVLSFFLPFVFLLFYVLLHAGQWVVVKSGLPVKLDAVMVFRGEGVRGFYRDTLAKQYPALIDVSCDTCSNTRSESRFIADYSIVHPDRVIGLVSGPYHMRRIEREIRMAGAENGSFCFLPVPFEYYNHTGKEYRNLLYDTHMRNLILFEIRKMAFYTFQNRFQSEKG